MENDKKSLEERAKEVAKLWFENKKWNINPFTQYREMNEIINYFKENDYIDTRFGTNKYFSYFEINDKGKNWAFGR